MTLPISLVIPTMNRPESLYRTLSFVAQCADIPAQVIVVDQSQEVVIRNKNKSVLKGFCTIFSALNYEYQQLPSLTKARNRGLNSVEYDIIIFADDDIDVKSDTFTNVYKIFQDSTIAMIAGIDELSKKSSNNFIGYFLGTKSFWKRNIGHVTKSMLGRYPVNIGGQIETQWAMGYFFAIRKTLMDKWDCRWDENLTSYAYAEDLDFSFNYYKHAKANGLKCVLDPSVTVKHLATLEYRIPSAKTIYMYVINRAYLGYKHNMGISGELYRFWCNLNRLLQHIITRNNPKVFMHAMWCTLRYHKDIVTGNIDYDKFMKK